MFDPARSRTPASTIRLPTISDPAVQFGRHPGGHLLGERLADEMTGAEDVVRAGVPVVPRDVGVLDEGDEFEVVDVHPAGGERDARVGLVVDITDEGPRVLDPRRRERLLELRVAVYHVHLRPRVELVRQLAVRLDDNVGAVERGELVDERVDPGGVTRDDDVLGETLGGERGGLGEAALDPRGGEHREREEHRRDARDLHGDQQYLYLGPRTGRPRRSPWWWTSRRRPAGPR
jgi:hypothetical protein